MTIALWIFFSLLAYAGIGLSVGRRVYNIRLLARYKREIKSLTNGSQFTVEWKKEHYNVTTVQEIALRESQKYCMAKEDSALNGLLWPVMGVWYWMYLEAKQYQQNTNKKIRIFPKNAVEKLIDEENAEIQRKADLEKAYSVLEEAGIDTAKIRELNR